ncbi:alpha/beta fold hydrolase [Actinospica sp. MGRD01-02]|uniref:Alpha/beta fold hydrolase n=1 Tax=Actinospica acidithermotolerans TaxID=2828514 RepID=A0A941E844_9ACTN|nr:alpha/beta fold hydrolase [Actinospica acidithermotolerans]MBR7825220.1 alpha/beta fold hydrolase [Actinospica acidithermotolerans]
MNPLAESGLAKAPDGTHIAYQVNGDGPPLLLLAGQANNHHWCDGVRDDFAGVRTTITLDYRGTGDSDKPDAPYSIEIFAQDALAVLDHLGIESADLYGTSMGGRTAQVIAGRFPQRVRKLILGCTSPGGAHGIERSDAVRRSLAQLDRNAARQALAELMYTPAWLAEHPGPHQTMGDLDMPDHARRHHLRASAGHDAWDLLPAIRSQTLVLHGADDVFNPAANAPLITGRIPDARLLMVEGARHAYFEEFRSVAGPLALDFLD